MACTCPPLALDYMDPGCPKHAGPKPDAPKPGPPERVTLYAAPDNSCVSTSESPSLAPPGPNWTPVDHVLASAYDKLAEENAELRATVDEFVESNNRLEAEAKDLLGKNANLCESIHKKEADNERLRAELREAKESNFWDVSRS